MIATRLRFLVETEDRANNEHMFYDILQVMNNLLFLIVAQDYGLD